MSTFLTKEKNPTHQVLSRCCPKTTTAIHDYNTTASIVVQLFMKGLVEIWDSGNGWGLRIQGILPKQNSLKKVWRKLRIMSMILARPLCLTGLMSESRWMKSRYADSYCVCQYPPAERIYCCIVDEEFF